MRIKNLYQCDENCKKCNYVNKHPTGFSVMDECETDICPSKHEKLGNIDRLGGRHMDGYGWNPLGEFCNQCKHDSCEDCIKWANRDKKLRNNIPPALKQEKKSQPTTPIKSENKPEIKTDSITNAKTETKEENKNIPIKDSTINTKEDKTKTNGLFAFVEQRNDMQTTLENETSVHTFVDREIVVDNEEVDDFDLDDFNTSIDKERNKQLFDETADDNNYEDSNDEDIDFGFDTSSDDDYDEYQDISFDDDDIPSPYDTDDSYDEDDADEDDEDTEDEDKTDNNTNVLNDDKNELRSIIGDIDDDDDYDEDDDAFFEMYEPTSKLKASILFSAGTKIARYQVRAKGVLLTVAGDAKVTVKGSDDSTGFSYCDPNRFPQYVRKGILNGELYKNPNMQITDNSYFVVAYFHDSGDDLIIKKQIPCGTDLGDMDEDKIRMILAKTYNSLVNN